MISDSNNATTLRKPLSGHVRINSNKKFELLNHGHEQKRSILTKIDGTEKVSTECNQI